MKNSTIIIYLITIITAISLVCTLVWTLIELFIGSNSKLAGYSFVVSFLLTILMFKLSMKATDKEQRRLMEEHKQ